MTDGRGRVRAALAAAALVAAAVAVHGAAIAAGDALAARAAAGLVELGDTVAVGREGAGPEDDDAGPPLADVVALGEPATVDLPRGLLEVATLAPPRAIDARGTPRASSTAPPAPSGILVRAAAVRAAIGRGGMPSGAPIAADGARPAGLVLSGVSGYGTALRDGDVLVRVGGTTATSEGRVIAAVSGAVRSGARAIDGEVWRAGRRIQVVVEIPRLRKRARPKD